MHVKKRGKFVIHRCHSISNENHIKIKHNLLQCFCNKLSPMNREFLLRLFVNLERVYFIFLLVHAVASMIRYPLLSELIRAL